VSVGGILSRVLSAEAVACSHCGSTELYPYPGLFGELGGVLGRVRYACRACRRHTWLSADAEVPQPPPDEVDVEVPSLPKVAACLAALDFDAAPLPPPRTDLRGLDDEIARVRRRRNRR
jgi:hypothetical protein